MMRLRAFASVLGCFAVLAGGRLTVAAAAGPAGAPVSERGAASVPCSDCDDCDGMPCPMPAATCMHVASNAAPTLAAAAIDLPAPVFSKVHWSLRTTTLSGLSLPPDPFPPRA
jgi:hypothetical protein